MNANATNARTEALMNSETGKQILAWVTNWESTHRLSLGVIWGSKFARVVDTSNAATLAFASLESGDLLKAASQHQPATGVRGNVFTSELEDVLDENGSVRHFKRGRKAKAQTETETETVETTEAVVEVDTSVAEANDAELAPEVVTSASTDFATPRRDSKGRFVRTN